LNGAYVIRYNNTMLSLLVRTLFNTVAPGGVIGPHANHDKELMDAGIKPVTLMGSFEGLNVSEDSNPMILKWEREYHEMAEMAENGDLLRMDFTVQDEEGNDVNFTLFGQHGEENAMNDIVNAYEYEFGVEGAEPPERDMGLNLGYSEADVRLWNVMNAVMRYAPFLGDAVNNYMQEINVPRQQANIQRMLSEADNAGARPTEPHQPV